MGLMTFTDRFPGGTLREHAARFPSSAGDMSLPKDGVAVDVKAVAHVNAGRWIAACPQPGCGGAEYVNFADPRFFCCECRNAGTKGVPVTVKVPSEKDRAAIEAALIERPVPATRNWAPGETAKQLLAENTANGVS